MVGTRWLTWVGPGVAALGAVALIASTTFGAGDRPWAPPACGGPPSAVVAAASEPGPSSLTDLHRAPWFRMDPRLDRDGALRAQQLAVGLGGDRDPSVELPPESFVAGPFGRIVLVGSDDGSRSRLRAFDVASGCAWTIADESDVIRRATADPARAGIYETRVERTTRADLGVWLRPLDGSGPAHRILAPLPADDRFGRTFSTEFTWDVAAERLAVQSCGEVACRTRILTPGRSGSITLDAPDLGVLVGLDDRTVVAYGACRGMPCAIHATSLHTGERRTLEPNGGPATVLATPDGARLVLETIDAAGRGLRSIALDGSATADLGPIPDGLSPQSATGHAGASTRLPSGWVLLAPDGRLPADRATARSFLRHIPDGATVPLDEATR